MTALLPVQAAESPATVATMLQTAIERGASVEALEKLVALHERLMARQAAADFAAALARFQGACPSIPKTSTAKIATRGGASYTYDYAELDEIAKHVGPLLHREGFSYSWDSEFRDDMLHCVCTLRHANGHEAKAHFALPVTTASAMSDQQKHAAALTYARRQSLVQVLGLTTTDPDTDAAPDESPRITDAQVVELEDLIAEAKVDGLRFLAWLNLRALSELPARRFDEAKAVLKRKIEARA